MSIHRAVIDAMLPPGWNVESDGDLDHLLDGMAKNSESVYDFMSQLSLLRNPALTPWLSDLEREFGVITRTNLAEAIRRARMETRMYERKGTGSKDDLEIALTRVGFDVQVHQNDPAVDPALFLTQAFQLCCGDPTNAFAGDPNAYCGRIGGELLVNGPIYDQSPLYLSECGGPFSYAGDPYMYCGWYDELRRIPIVYQVPADPGNWPFVFFVGGDATRDPVTDELTDIMTAEVPIERKEEFQNIILQYKPKFTWAGLIITYV